MRVNDDGSFDKNPGLDSLRVSPAFQRLNAAAVDRRTSAQAADKALTTVAVEVKWHNGFPVAGVFEDEFSDVTSSYAGKGVVRYAS